MFLLRTELNWRSESEWNEKRINVKSTTKRERIRTELTKIKNFCNRTVFLFFSFGLTDKWCCGKVWRWPRVKERCQYVNAGKIANIKYHWERKISCDFISFYYIATPLDQLTEPQIARSVVVIVFRIYLCAFTRTPITITFYHCEMKYACRFLGNGVVESKPSDARIDVTMCANVCDENFSWEFVALQLCFGDEWNNVGFAKHEEKNKKKNMFSCPKFQRYLIRAFNCCHSMQIIHKITFFFSENSAATSITIFHWAVFKRTLTNNQIFAHNFSDNTISKYKKQTPKQNILRRAVDFLCCLFSAPYRITQHPERY